MSSYLMNMCQPVTKNLHRRRLRSAVCGDLIVPPMGAGTGEQGGQAPTLEKIRVGMAHPGNFSRG